jgi:uncharacterized protein (TIGR02300 family)
VGKPELGTKRICPSCGTKYYDLNRSPIVCPHCGTVFQVTAAQRPERVAAVARPVEKPEPTAEIEREEGVVSLEDVEVAEEGDIGPDVDEADEAVPEEVAAEGEEVEVGEDDTFLQEEEEEGDVTVLLDVDAEEEEER